MSETTELLDYDQDINIVLKELTVDYMNENPEESLEKIIECSMLFNGSLQTHLLQGAYKKAQDLVKKFLVKINSKFHQVVSTIQPKVQTYSISFGYPSGITITLTWIP